MLSYISWLLSNTRETRSMFFRFTMLPNVWHQDCLFINKSCSDFKTKRDNAPESIPRNSSMALGPENEVELGSVWGRKIRGLTIRPRQRHQRRWKIDSASFETISRLSQVFQLLKRRGFMLSSYNELTHFLKWMKNTLLFTYSTNILVRLLTVNIKNFLTPKIRNCATPF